MLIRKFKKTLASLSDSQANLSGKNKVVYIDRRYFGVKSKSYAENDEKRCKRTSSVDKWISRSKKIGSKKVKINELMQ